MKKIPIIPIEERFSWIVPSKPYYLGLMIKWGIFSMYKKYQLSWPEAWVFFENNSKAYFYDYANEVTNCGLNILDKRYKKNGQLRNAKQEYKKIVSILNSESDKINLQQLKKLNNKELINKYKYFLSLLKEFWFHGILAELSGYGSEAYLNKNVTYKSFPNRDEIINTLLKLSDYSFHQKEEIEMLQILINAKINKKINEYNDWLEYLKTHKILKEKIDNHAEKYNWINNGYASCEPQKKSFFYKSFWQAINSKEKPKNKLAKITKDFKVGEINRKKVLSKIPPGELKIYAKRADGSVNWHDDKKAKQLKFQRSLHYFLKDIARRHKLDFNKLLNCLPSEIDKIIISGKLPLKELKKREKLFLVHSNSQQFEVITGENIDNAFKVYTKPEFKNVEELKGSSAAKIKDKVVGKVRIILSLKDLSKMKSNEILVADMTSPEYISGIKKAKAIITDEGGMTCHAAIVSRELGIPCVVGTKVATKVLKDGDLVEVDANNGIIKKI